MGVGGVCVAVSTAAVMLKHAFVLVGASVTRLGDFWKALVTNFQKKVAQIFSGIWGHFETCPFLKNNAVATFWATFQIF